MLLHKMRDKHFWTGFDTASQTTRTISNAALAAGIFYSFVVWFWLPAMSAKHPPTCDYCDHYGLAMGFWDSFFASGNVRWLIALVGAPCIAKEFLIRDKRITMVLNLAYVCFLLCLSIWWLDTLFAPHIH